MRIKILRRQTPASEPYWETFAYDGPPDVTVAGLLDHINHAEDIVNADGERSTCIGWECSCLQGVCGACAMVVNETPVLACETPLRSLNGTDIEIRPLRKFPVVRDLIIDRSVISENLMGAGVFIGEYRPSADGDHAHQYAAAKCLKCGLCLEVCPNYVNGKTFFGAAFVNDCYLAASRNSARAGEIKAVYDEHFGSGCSKALSCMDVCPMKIPTMASMAKLNRQRRSK